MKLEFDAVENLSMFACLNGSTGWLVLARVMAILKSMLVIVHILAGTTILAGVATVPSIGGARESGQFHV